MLAKSLRASLVALLLAFAASSQRAEAAVAIVEVVSPGGIEAWLVEEHSVPLVAATILFKGGAAEDPGDKAGLSYMVSGLLDEGAGDLDSQAFQERLEDLSIRLGFDADRDSFEVSLYTLSENSAEAFRLMGLAVAKPRFDDKPVERIRRQILSILARADENPQKVASETWYRKAFGGDPYGRPVEGSPETIEAIASADLKGFARRRFNRADMVVAVVGDITAEELGRLLDEAFGELPAAGRKTELGEASFVAAPGLEVVRKPIPQSTVVFGHAGIKRDHPDWYAAYVMNHVLGGGGFSSRLIDEVREKRGLAYSVYSYLNPMDRFGLFMGGVATENARVGQSIDIIRRELERLWDEGVTAEELDDAKTYLTGSFPLSFDTSRKIAAQLAYIQREGLGIAYVERRNDFIEAVTVEQIRRVAGRLLQPENLLWVVVGDPAGLGTVESGGDN